jgi:hypothetical protein
VREHARCRLAGHATQTRRSRRSRSGIPVALCDNRWPWPPRKEPPFGAPRASDSSGNGAVLIWVFCAWLYQGFVPVPVPGWVYRWDVVSGLVDGCSAAMVRVWKL